MTSVFRIRPKFVEFIPNELEFGVLYISRPYSTASHLCCCGCGLEVVTPLNSAKWHLTQRTDEVSLYPSIGNWGFACKSHYWIKNNEVHWAARMSAGQIAAVKAHDHFDAIEFGGRRSAQPRAIGELILRLWSEAERTFSKWFGRR